MSVHSTATDNDPEPRDAHPIFFEPVYGNPVQQELIDRGLDTRAGDYENQTEYLEELGLELYDLAVSPEDIGSEALLSTERPEEKIEILLAEIGRALEIYDEEEPDLTEEAEHWYSKATKMLNLTSRYAETYRAEP